MAKKRAARAGVEISKPKQLRKRLRKAEDQLADAVSKRDRAQARVEALSIIADEIRAQLAEADKADEGAEVAEAVSQDAVSQASAGTGRRRKRAPGADDASSAGDEPVGEGAATDEGTVKDS